MPNPGNLLERLRKTSHIETVSRNTRLHKTNTIRLESQEEINGNLPSSSSLPASPPRSLQLPRGSSQEDRIDVSNGDQPIQGRRPGQGQTVDSEDPDAILPLPLPLPIPASVRQRQSFPHELPG